MKKIVLDDGEVYYTDNKVYDSNFIELDTASSKKVLEMAITNYSKSKYTGNKYIENNYMQKITIGDIAAAVGFSESHFMRYFKETMGTSFVEYLRDYRLTIASRLLTSSDSSILNIAAETGFENLSYFNRVFKEKYKMTPRQFRKESRLNE